jgi:hypothetical protein
MPIQGNNNTLKSPNHRMGLEIYRVGLLIIVSSSDRSLEKSLLDETDGIRVITSIKKSNNACHHDFIAGSSALPSNWMRQRHKSAGKLEIIKSQ